MRLLLAMVPIIASNGWDALDWMSRGNTFDLAIVDLELPEMGGAALAEEMRKIDKNMPLVMLTSPDHEATLHISDTRLAKPISPFQLHNVLMSILSPRSVTVGEVENAAQISLMHILLAEDNVSNQKVVLQMLKRLGCTADVAANGIEALQALERQHYDLVLMDVKMPKMDGLEATRIIRQRWPDNGPKVVAVTAYALEGDMEKCLEAGMDDYISKPVRMEELVAVLRKFEKNFMR